MSWDSGANQGAGDGSDDVEGYAAPQPYSSHDDPSGTRILPPPGSVPPGPSGWPPPPGYQQPGSYPPPGGYGGYPPPPPPGYGPPPATFSSYPQGYGGYAGAAPRTDGAAIAALVLSICSFVVCPLIPAVVALALIPGSRRTINNSGGAVAGLGLLTAAKIISWINVGLVVVVFGIIVIAALASSGSSSNGLAHLVAR